MLDVRQIEVNELYKIAARKQRLVECLADTIKMMEKELHQTKKELEEYKKVVKLRNKNRVR